MVRRFQYWSAWVVVLELFAGVAWFVNRPVPLVEAVRQWESGGSEHKVGDKKLKYKAYTSLQIRKLALDDVNKFFAKEIKKNFGQKELTVEYLKQNRVALDWVFEKYTGRYATRERLKRKPTDEDRARIWNGGPNGWKKPSTREYGKKVVATIR